MQIGAVSIVVPDYDEAVDFFVTKLRFVLVENVDMGDGKRWVTVAPHSATGAQFVLAKAVGEEQLARVGRQCGGRVGFFLETDNFVDDYNFMKRAGVTFCEEPRNEIYGTVVVFEDRWGNKYDLIQRKATTQ